MEFGVLGPVEIRIAGTAAAAGYPRQRTVLVALLLDLGRVVPTELLIDRVWGDEPPGSVRNVLYGYLARLRAIIAEAADQQVTLTRLHGGYVLQAGTEQLDLLRFRRRVARACAATDDDHAARLLREALGLWRGPALAGVDSPWVSAMRATLQLERTTAAMDLNDVRLRQGQHGALVSELAGQAAARPADERLAGQLMLALYRSGQQAESLRRFEHTRRLLAEELGAAPGPGLQALHQRILRADPSLAGPQPATRWPATKPIGDPGRFPDSALASVRAAGEIFVGRSKELAALQAAAAAARAGQPAVVLVEGEAGIGKSSLLSQFVSGLSDAAVLRASGDEAEQLVPYGTVAQLTASAGNSRGPAGLLAAGLLAARLSDAVDPIPVGAELVAWLGQLCADHKMVLAVIDDLHWADGPSARALLFAMRRLQAAQILILVSARTAQLARLGDGWRRFLAGDHRVFGLRLGGFTPAEVAQLGRALGRGDLPLPVVRRLIAETGGHPMYCRAVLEEAGTDEQLAESLLMPRSLAGLVLGRVGPLSPAARKLVGAAAVLGSRCRLPVAARLAQLADPVPALEEAVAAGVLTERLGAAGTDIGFSHLLVQRAIYADLSPQRRRGLHIRAAGLVDQGTALGHRVAAATGPDDQLAAELEASAQQARHFGRLAQAAAWLAQAAELSTGKDAASRRYLESLETLVNFGELAVAEKLVARIGTIKPSTRYNWLLGTLDFLAGRMATAEPRLADAWRTHHRDQDAAAGCAAATRLTIMCASAGRTEEAIEWGERAVAAAPAATWQHAAVSALAISLGRAGRGTEAAAHLATFDDSPADVPPEDTDTLVLRGIARNLANDLGAALADLSVAAARLRSGVPLRTASWCLLFLASTEYRYGSWNDAVLDAEMAVSLASDTDRTWELGFAHSLAAVIPALRGDWDTAAAHVRMAHEGAHANGDLGALGAASVAQQYLAMAQGDLEGVLVAAAATRAGGSREFYCLADTYDWRLLEIEALILLSRVSHAESALATVEADLSVTGSPAAWAAAGRLRAELALAAGDPATAAATLQDAWHHARDLQAPLLLAQLETTDARSLRTNGQPAAAIARLTSARQRLSRLRAAPLLHACDRELAIARAMVVTGRGPSSA